MTEPSPIDVFLVLLRRSLDRRRWLSGYRCHRVMTEVEDHLRETARELQSMGASPEEAQRQAVERFGAVDQIAREWTRFDLEGLQGLVRLAVGFLAALTTIAATAMVIQTLLSNEGTLLWNVSRFLASAYTVAIGSLSIVHIWSGRPYSPTLAAGALGLLVLGILVMIRSSYMALVGPDPEYWIVLLGGFMTAQAAGILLDLGIMKRKLA